MTFSDLMSTDAMRLWDIKASSCSHVYMNYKDRGDANLPGSGAFPKDYLIRNGNQKSKII